ncbi:unnamed protein product [Schistosoma curassoni]|uniref:Uncharacterized protein n=1 Tax=Schistosoma curassoni TaxID=6186 RepID=A0A183KM63_9TREM|nr:unnamed protein product [Schistosoma curassoni]
MCFLQTTSITEMLPSHKEGWGWKRSTLKINTSPYLMDIRLRW